MNATGGQGGLGRFYNYKETFAADNIWVDIPTTRMLCSMILQVNKDR